MNIFSSTILTVGFVSASILAVNHLFSSSIEQQLTNEGLVALRKKDDAGWNINKTKNLKEINGELNEDDIFDWCKSSYLLTYEKYKNVYEKVKKFCLKPETIKEKIERENSNLKSVLENEKIAEEKVNFYNSYSTLRANANIEIKKGQRVLKEDMNRQKLKIWCEHKINEYVNENLYNEVKTWCYGE